MQSGSPLELYNNPANQFVAGFIGSPKMNFIQVKAADRTGVTLDGTRLETGRTITRETLTLGIRPEHLGVGEGQGQTMGDAQVELVEHLGGSTVLHLRPSLGAQTMTVVLAGQQAVRPGDVIPLRIDPSHCHFFDPEGQTLPR